MTTRRVLGGEDFADWYSPSHRDSPEAPNRDMTITVGWNAAQRADVTREQMDAWAYRSHMRAVAAIDAGVGDRVLVLDEGNGARQILGDSQAPIRSVVVGIVDSVDLD